MAINDRLTYHARRGTTGHFNWRDVRAIFNQQSGKCFYCKENFERKRGSRHSGIQQFIFDIEHRTPVSRGGSNYRYNLCLACPKCNIQKGTQTDAEFTGRTFKPGHILRKKSPAESSEKAPRRGAGGTSDEAPSAIKVDAT